MKETKTTKLIGIVFRLTTLAPLFFSEEWTPEQANEMKTLVNDLNDPKRCLAKLRRMFGKPSAVPKNFRVIRVNQHPVAVAYKGAKASGLNNLNSAVEIARMSPDTFHAQDNPDGEYLYAMVDKVPELANHLKVSISTLNGYEIPMPHRCDK